MIGRCSSDWPGGFSHQALVGAVGFPSGSEECPVEGPPPPLHRLAQKSAQLGLVVGAVGFSQALVKWEPWDSVYSRSFSGREPWDPVYSIRFESEYRAYRTVGASASIGFSVQLKALVGVEVL